MGVTKYLWNDITDTVAMEKDGAGNTTAVYASDPVPFGRLRSMRRGGTTYNYHFDGRGNTTRLTDQTGRKTDAYTYDAFGTPRTATGSTENPYRFGGQHGYQYNPATDAYYVRARAYEPRQGRWQSKDPLRSADGLSPYIYAGNGPVDAADPSGMLNLCYCSNVNCVSSSKPRFKINLPPVKKVGKTFKLVLNGWDAILKQIQLIKNCTF